ncbi:hypothetical protein PNK_0931 [Candidatus Protochlamydia naegleriophila]|uniref:Uncharacterized protein n=1 Tax=Candidatus Protochlamydia naegleriophila TaxID=389348 RepID=A0A0U5CPA3_9BACT|nr:MarR family transcriptional regulator [Candidatus Protochlamydia naegleriophila]CUI16556.1 hypothetical protein PNK_0931 [Candidatus Protochlamydia naegleriophila]
MNVSSIVRKTKIVLTDYPYRRDIENRLLLSHLSIIEVDVLQEILHSSLKISVDQLADSLDISAHELIVILDRLSATKLFKREQHTLTVDKEMRKYYEIQLEKFDDDFEPNLEFLQSLLNKVPIHILPAWYAIPRSSDNIFASIVEKFFLTPKIYRQHLEELEFDDPILTNIMQDVYQAPGFKLTASALIEKYNLSRERFEEALLQLEYHFVCCLTYRRMGDHWEEVVTPFYEWHEYLLFESTTRPKAIVNKAEIQSTCSKEFGFISEMASVLSACQSKPIQRTALTPLYLQTTKEFDSLLAKLIQFGFIQQAASGFSATDKGVLWLKKSIYEQVNALAVDWLSEPPAAAPFSASLWNPRNLRLIEKYLKRLHHQEWVYLDDFLKGFAAPLGDREPISLKNKGKKWKYLLPTYLPEELAFIRLMITERLFELGIVSTGLHNNQVCFCVTPFGHQFIH